MEVTLDWSIGRMMSAAVIHMLTMGYALPSWSSHVSGPRVSGQATAVTESGRMLLYGGLTGSAGSPCTDTLWSHDGDAWHKVETQGEAPGPCMYAAAAAVGEDFYLVGGWDPQAPGSGGTFLSSAYKLVDGQTWERLDDLPVGPVSRHTACAVGNLVIVHTFRGIVLLDPDTGKFREQATSGEAPDGLSMCAASPLGDGHSMLLFGGSTKTQQMSADAYVLDTTTWAWRKLKAEGADGAAVPTPRASSCAAPAGDGKSCIVYGGAGLGGGGYEGGRGLCATDETWRVHVAGDTATWELVDAEGAKPPPRVAASLNALKTPGKFVLQGGWDPASKETFEATSVLAL